jgi:hypothetical protein
MARWGLTRLKEKKQRKDRNELELDRALGHTKEFNDPYLEVSHPTVSKGMIERLQQIDPNLVLCWELQFYFEHRWHVKWKDQGEMKSVIILQNPPYPIKAGQDSAEFVPFDERALKTVARLMYQVRHGLQRQAVNDHLDKVEQKEQDRVKSLAQLEVDWNDDHRHIHERMDGTRNASDPGWEAGVGFDADGVPFAEGSGAHSRNMKRAI